MKNKDWDKKDIASIIVYRSEYRGTNEKIAIINVYKDILNTVGAIEYPLELNSRIMLVGLLKHQEKKDKDSLENAGDWYFVGKVPKKDREEIKRLSKSRKNISDCF